MQNITPLRAILTTGWKENDISKRQIRSRVKIQPKGFLVNGLNTKISILTKYSFYGNCKLKKAIKLAIAAPNPKPIFLEEATGSTIWLQWLINNPH